MTDKSEILLAIRTLAERILPDGGSITLFGSQARGDAVEDSDWDLLILLEQERISNDDFNAYAFPFIELGWKKNIEINPLIYTYSDWNKRHFTPFYKNITAEGIVLWS